MCGIFGIINKNNQVQYENGWLNDILSTISHRGPDEQGLYIDNGIALGHVRLSIIDLSSGQQPMHSEDDRYIIVFNGEIYNYKNLQKKMQADGYKFNSNSDTEVILKTYSVYKEKCVEQLQGMFAFAIWDKQQRSLFIARDRLGIKPLYLYEDDKAIIFSSEVKAIYKTGLVQRTVNTTAIDMFMTLGFVPAPVTLFGNITKLEPGYLACVDNNLNVTKSRYWQIPVESKNNSTVDKKSFYTQIEKAVSSHLVSDVPLGAFLSGGVDSSAVVALMTRITGSRVNTFSVGYPDQPESNELQYADIVARKFNTIHHEYHLQPTDFFDSLEFLLHYSEEPIDEPAGVALFQLSKLARDHVKVVLAGEGMDEVMGGYPIYQKMRKIEKLSKLYRHVIPENIHSALGKLTKNEKYLKYLDWLSVPLNKRYRTVNSRLTQSIKNNIYNSGVYKESIITDYFDIFFRNYEESSDLRIMSVIDTISWLPDCLLLRGDKMTMAASLEMRVPFLDHKFVEFCMGLPDHAKIYQGESKYLLKHTMEGILPDEILYRKKAGFPVPISDWFRNQLFGRVSDILTSQRFFERGYFSKDYILRILKEHKNCKQDHGIRLFYILILELWHRMYIDIE